MPDATEQRTRAGFGVHDVFVGADGLRAGWAILLFVFFWQAFRLMLYPLVSSVIPRQSAGENMHPGHLIPLEAAGVVCVLAATWLMSRIEGRQVTAYGLSERHILRNFGVGAVCGAVLLSLLVLSLIAMGALVFDGRQLFGAGALRYSAVWLIGFLIVGVFEELLFRGYVQFTIARGMRGLAQRLLPRHADAAGFWTAALMTSFYFGFGHRTNPGESPVGLVSAGLIGLAFCLSIWRTGSLWWAIGFHMAWDWAESFVYGVADSGGMIQGHLLATHPAGQRLLSGGLTGPEGSVVVLPIIGLACCAAVLTVPRRRSVDGPEPYPQESASAATAVTLH